MTSEPDYLKERHLKYWIHKQKLDVMISFDDRLNYWRANIDDYPSSYLFSIGEASDIFDMSNPKFSLDVRPEAQSDHEALFRCHLDCWRKRKAEKQWPVMSFNPLDRDDPSRIVFHVQSIDELKADFEQRLSLSLRKRNTIETEVKRFTEIIDEVARIVKDYRGKKWSSPQGRCINKLRMHIDTLTPYDFITLSEQERKEEAQALGEVWDIVYYEAYLKDLLESFRSNSGSILDFQELISSKSSTEIPELDRDTKLVQNSDSFVRLLIGNFSKNKLDSMLLHLGITNPDGETMLSNKHKSALYGIVKALLLYKYLENEPQVKLFNSLCGYLGLTATDIKEGYSTIQTKYHSRAKAYLDKLRIEQN